MSNKTQKNIETQIVTWALTVWRKPLMGEYSEEIHVVHGTIENFRELFGVFYGRDKERAQLFDRILEEKDLTLGKGTYGFKLQVKILDDVNIGT